MTHKLWLQIISHSCYIETLSAKCICSEDESVIEEFFGFYERPSPVLESAMDHWSMVQNSLTVQKSPTVQKPPVMPEFWPEFQANLVEKRIYFYDDIENQYICYVLMWVRNWSRRIISSILFFSRRHFYWSNGGPKW